MRRFFSVLCIAIIAIVAISCNNDEAPNTGKKGALSFTTIKADAVSIEVKITPASSTQVYYAGFYTAAEMAEVEDAIFISEVIDGTRDLKSRKGEYTIAQSGLNPDTEYVIVAFLYGETEELIRYSVTTMPQGEILSPDKFDITIEISDITAYSAKATVTPNANNRYFFRIVTEMELKTNMVYGDDYATIQYCWENPRHNDYVYIGEQTIDLSLYYEMKYIAIAFDIESLQAVADYEIDPKLFSFEFETPASEPIPASELFVFLDEAGNEIQAEDVVIPTDAKDFTLKVKPVRGENSFWSYWVWKTNGKWGFDATLAQGSRNMIVMQSYYGINNMGVDHGYTFEEMMTNYTGFTGTQEIHAYEMLDNNTDYTIVLFYMDPEAKDVTIVYDYSFVAIDFKTTEPKNGYAKLEVSEPIIKREGFNYNVGFNIKTDEKAKYLYLGMQFWKQYDFEMYWDPQDWTSVQDFFKVSKQLLEGETLTQAISAEGAVVTIPEVSKEEAAFFFEARTEENAPTQYGYHLTLEDFENAN